MIFSTLTLARWVLLMTMLVGEEGQVALGTLVGVVALVPALVAGDLLQRGRHFDERRRLVVLVMLSVVAGGALVVVVRVRGVPGVVHGVDVVAVLQTAHVLLARVGLVPELAAVVARGQLLVHLIFADLSQRRQLEARMHVLAGGSLRAESGQVVHAEHPPQVLVPAVRTVAAEAALVPRAVLHLRLGIDVQEGALLVVAGVEAGVEVALRHLGHVVLVQELALVALLAEATQPVLAHDGPVAADVSEGAGAALVALLPVPRGGADEVADRRYGLVHSVERQRDGADLLDQVPLRLELQPIDVGQEDVHF